MANQWLDTSEYPFSPNFFEINGQKMHYVDEGQGEILLFVHGTPSWSFDFRKIIKNLSSHYRCIAIDHIGFGLSDKPKNYVYSTQNRSKTLEKFILAQNLSQITLIVHDFGGPIGLDVAMKHPERFKKFVILNSWLWSSATDPDFIKLKGILKSPLLPLLYRYFNFSPRFLLSRSFGNKKISKHILRHYTEPFPNKSSRNGPLAFARSLLNDQEWFEELWNNKHTISEKTSLFIWGMKDPILKPHYLEKFISGFPNSMTIKLDTCGHFPQEEEPEKVSKAIVDFVKS